MDADYLNEMLIFEERGVGAYKYKDVIDDICNYCERKASDLYYRCYLWSLEILQDFYIPDYMTSKIDFVDKIHICITPQFVSSYEYGKCGRLITYSDNKSETDTVQKICIEIILQINKRSGDIYYHSLYNTIYRELNYAYRKYCFIKDDINVSVFDLRSSGIEPRNDLSKNIIEKLVFTSNDSASIVKANFFSYLFYMIFDKFYFKSKLNWLYDDLKTLYNTDAMFNDILNKTEIYRDYKYIYDNIDVIFDLLSQAEFETMMQILTDIGVKHMWDTKYSFLKCIKRWLEYFSKQINKAATLYYDELTDIYEVDDTICFINYSMPKEFVERLKEFFEDK